MLARKISASRGASAGRNGRNAGFGFAAAIIASPFGRPTSSRDNGLSRCLPCASNALRTLSPCGRGSTARSAVGVRGSFSHDSKNGAQHSFQIRQHIVVPEPQNEKTIRREPFVASTINRRVRVLTAVHLDDHAGVIADEIGDERSNRPLPAKLE